jgi:iron complex outermembrane receptor protein
LRFFILYIILLVPFQVKSQYLISNDTIRINEVIISENKENTVLPGFRMTLVDSAALKQFTHGTIGDAISYDSPIYIKNYGTGGAATSSLRGTGASGTQVAWNGITINNPMLGQSDLSLFSTGFSDRVEIYYGGASMILNSGATGGIISLISKPSFQNRTSISFKPAIGSFGKYSAQVSAETGTSEFQSVTKAFYQVSQNNFSFIDAVSRSEPFRDIRRDNELSQKGIIQEFYRKTSVGQLSAHLWYQEAQRNLPSSIITEFAGESQHDQSVRTILNFKANSGFSISGAWMMSNLDYRNRLARIDSRNHVQDFFLKSKFSRKISNKVIVGFLFNEVLDRVKSNNYINEANRNTADAAVSLETINSELIQGSLLVRQILFNKKLLLPDFSTGLRLKPFLSKNYFILYNISRSSRIPTMNDLYWNPGGNPDLKNEYALMSELGFEMNVSKRSVTMDYDIALFHNSIKDMIQWRPGEFSYWSAFNIQNAITKGIETSATLTYKTGNIISVLKAGYSFTRATYSRESGKQLIYVPQNMANGSLRVRYGMFYSAWLTNMTGLRFTTEDNSDYLPAYTISSLSLGIERSLGWGKLDLSLDIDNIFNVAYENIAYYPLPGRAFELRLLAQTTFKK